MNRGSRPTLTGPAAVAAAVVLLLGVAALETPRGPVAQRSLPPAPPVALDVHDPVLADELLRSGISLGAGWRPTDLLVDRRPEPAVDGAVDPAVDPVVDPWSAGDPWDPWALADGPDGVSAWQDLLPGLRLLYDTEGRLLVEDAVVVPRPSHCYHLVRTVRRIGVGLPPPAGPAIAEQLEAWLEPPYFSGVPPPVGRGPCAGDDRSQWGFAIEQAETLPCEVPGREVICFTLAKWRHDFGPRDTWTSTHRTFSVATGDRLDDEALHAGLDVAAFDRLVDEAVCAFGGRCDGIAVREGRIHPTRAALIVEFSPGEAADVVHGSLRLTVPRTALPLLP